MKEILTVDLNNSIHAAKCIRMADKHKAIAAKWRSQAQAEDRRMAKEENADPKNRPQEDCEADKQARSQLVARCRARREGSRRQEGRHAHSKSQSH